MAKEDIKKIILVSVLVGIVLGGNLYYEINKEINKSAQKEEVITERKPQVELTKYQEDISEFSLHYINGTIKNISDKALRVIVYADAYDENGKYINTYINIAQHLEPETEWDFYIQVSSQARKIKLRDFEISED